MGYERHGLLPFVTGPLFCLIGLTAQFLIARRLKCPLWLNILLLWFAAGTDAKSIPGLTYLLPRPILQDYFPGLIVLIHTACIGALLLTIAAHRVSGFDERRRAFLRTSTVAACAAPAAFLGAAVLTRKEFRVNEVNVRFPGLPKDLNGLRLLQISDIHLSTFYSRHDLRRVVDASNGLRADLAFITGDLITTSQDPLEDCLLELQRLKSSTGVWGCMGNHEAYANCRRYVKQRGSQLGMDFLRRERRSLRFGDSRLNLVGVDHEFHPPYLVGVDQLIAPGEFNLLLAHTPEVFETAQQQGFQLTLSGHTHGGQLNVELAGKNFNLVAFDTPYTKGLYRRGTSAIYVNSGLGTIYVPARIGAPPEISIIRLCNS